MSNPSEDPDLAEHLAESRRLVRQAHRRRLRRYGPAKDPIELPELTDVEPPRLLPGEPGSPPGPTGGWYWPDGTPIDLPRPQLYAAIAQMMSDHRASRIASSILYRAGVRLWISTVFLGLDYGWDAGPPVLWETMIFHGGNRRNPGHSRECWRYSSHSAALAGHRQIVDRLRAEQGRRRAASRAPMRHLAYARCTTKSHQLHLAYAGRRR